MRDVDALGAELREERALVQKLQRALTFWMPGVSEAIEIELDGRAGDDAYLLAGYEGEFPAKSWGDQMVDALESERSRSDRLEKALREIKKLKPEPIGDSGFQTGPAALLDQAKRLARTALGKEDVSD